MAINQDGWAASSELNKMRKNPLFNQLRTQSMVDTGRYGNLQQDVINYNKMSLGRENLNKFGSDYKNLYLPGSDNIGPAVNRRQGAAMGTSSEWAMPKLHDPFEWFRERCILPGELMNLQDGQKKVEDVVVGDIALTHKGRYRKVIGLGHKSYEGKAYSVEPYYLSKAKVTEDHPFWAKKKLTDEPDWIKVQHLSKKDWVFIPVDREVIDVEKINIFDHLDINDWVVEDNYITGKKEKLLYKNRSLRNQIPTEFEVTDEFLWLLGLYMAEGYSNDKAISWYISNQELYIRDRIIDNCKQVFGLDIRYSENKNDNTLNVCLTAQPLAKVFHNWCGKNAHDKHLPEWVMYLPVEKQRIILEGILDGDGCYQDDKIYFLSVSPRFTEQVRRLMLRCGYFPSISHRSKKDFKTQEKIDGTNTALILLGNDQYKFLSDINAIANNGYVYDKRLTGPYKPIDRKQRFITYPEDDGVWVQVRKIEEFNYSGEIYYFTVDEDHSFVIADQGVKNTWWFNMEDPDEQTRKIRDWCRLIYTTHYLVPSMIDIYSRFPLLGMEFSYPDKRVNEFFSELFWDGLQYQDFLYSLSREHWLIGDVFALGSWNDGIGAWEADELINPNDVIVAKNRALRTYQYHIKVPEEVKRLVETRQPEKEYAQLMAMYPDVIEYARKDVEIPVSDVLMKGIPWKCVVGSTPIMTPSGPVAARDLKVGDEVIAWNEQNNSPVVSTISHQGINSPEPIYWITTYQGRKIGVNGEHPFLTDDGWAKASDLTVGTNLLIGHGYSNISTDNTITDDDARFLGIMVGDGSTSGKTIMLHNIDQNLISWVKSYVSDYGCVLGTAHRGVSMTISQGPDATRSSKNRIKELIQRSGLRDQNCYTKRIPQIVWQSGPTAWAAFLSGYLDTDGSVNYKKGETIWVSSNRPLLEDCQTMLALLGIDSTLYDVPKYDYEKRQACYRLLVRSKKYNKALSRLLSPIIERKQIPIKEITGRSTAIFPYDQIKKIELGEPEETMAIGVDGFHTHITAGLVTHNTNPWAEHGTPILMRAFRQLMMEESLQASMEAIADRLYSPLILATLGLPDADQDGPWIPDAEELGMLRDDLATAINADFRLMVYHHGLQIQNAFGRESMPRLDTDFYRIQANYMMVFGIGSELLQGGKSGATYASGALNRELITQMLTTHQHQIKHFIQGRMRAVAERQGFYEYRNVGGHPVPIMETVLVVDEETGAQFVEERPKLAIPDIIFQSMSLQDENIERQFLQQLAGMGLPVSFQTFTRNAGIDFEDELETRKKEKVDLVIAEQQVKKDIFDRCFQLQLPIPMEYQSEYEAYIMQLQDPQLAAQLRPGAIQDISSLTPTPNISGAPVHVDAGGIPDMYPSIANQETLDAQQKKHPPESHEQKKTQPKRSKSGKPNGPQKKTASVEDLKDDEILVVSKKTSENIIFEDGDILSNVGAEGGDWGRFRKTNPKQASVTEEFNSDDDREIRYGERMKFSVPWESQQRVQMKLANGQKIVVDDNYEKYDEMYMKDHIAKILEANVVGPEDNDFNDKLNEDPIPTNMDFDHHQSNNDGFDAPAITGVNPADMGPKVTFGSEQFPNRRRPNRKDKDI